MDVLLVYRSVHHVLGQCPVGLRGVSGTLELEIQIGKATWLLGIKHRSSGGPVSVLTCWVISPALKIIMIVIIIIRFSQ